MPNLRLMRLTETLKKINTSLVSMGDIPKDIFVFLALLLIGAGAFMVGRISVGETERKNELKIISPSNVSAITEEAQFEANSSISEAQITSSASTTSRTFKTHQLTPAAKLKSGMYFGSKNGKVYYLPSCPSANRIKDENKIWFKDKQDAETRGYRPTSNCKGM